MHSRDDFKQTLIKQYSEFIEEIIVQSESVYRSQLDFNQLDKRVKGLMQSARVDGIEEGVIWGMLERRVPEYYQFVMNSTYANAGKIAA